MSVDSNNTSDGGLSRSSPNQEDDEALVQDFQDFSDFDDLEFSPTPSSPPPPPKKTPRYPVQCPIIQKPSTSPVLPPLSPSLPPPAKKTPRLPVVCPIIQKPSTSPVLPPLSPSIRSSKRISSLKSQSTLKPPGLTNKSPVSKRAIIQKKSLRKKKPAVFKRKSVAVGKTLRPKTSANTSAKTSAKSSSVSRKKRIVTKLSGNEWNKAAEEFAKNRSSTEAGPYKATKVSRTADELNSADNNPLASPQLVDMRTGTKKKKVFVPVFDIEDEEFEYGEISFLVKNDDGLPIVNPTEMEVLNKFLPDSLIREWSKTTNHYLTKRKTNQPDLKFWQRSSSRKVTASEIMKFLGIIHYMGLVKLPSKRDYWSTNPLMPFHQFINKLQMTRDRFEFIWRHFHMMENNGEIQEDFTMEEEDESYEFEHIKVRRNSDRSFVKDDDPMKWFYKVEPLVDHVSKYFLVLCVIFKY